MNHRSHLGGVLSTLLEQKAPKSLTPTRKVVQASTHANKHACTQARTHARLECGQAGDVVVQRRCSAPDLISRVGARLGGRTHAGGGGGDVARRARIIAAALDSAFRGQLRRGHCIDARARISGDADGRARLRMPAVRIR